jgi:hypothetical protein
LRLLKAVRFWGANDLDGFLLDHQMTIEERGRLVHKLKRRVIISITKLYTIGFTEVHDILKYLEGQCTIIHYTLGRDFWRRINLRMGKSSGAGLE